MVHCAVKTVNEQAGLKQRIEFLREASAMKDCKWDIIENVSELVLTLNVAARSMWSNWLGWSASPSPCLFSWNWWRMGTWKSIWGSIGEKSSHWDGMSVIWLLLRPDDQNNRDGHLQVPSLSKVLQMAADIADGMAYLGNKKIVHR